MRKYHAILTALMLLAAACGNNENTAIESAAKGYAQALADYRVDDAVPYASHRTSEVTLNFYRMVVGKLDPADIAANTPADITILNIKQLTDTTAYAVYHKSSPLTNINDTLRMIKEEGRWVVNQVIIIPSILDTTNHPQRRRIAPRKAKKLKRIPIDSVNVAKTKWAVDGPSTVQE